MTIKLVDGSIYEINDMKIENGTLYIDFKDKSAEEVQTILNQPANLGTIQLLDDENQLLAHYDNFTIQSGVLLNPDNSVIGMLGQQVDSTLLRIEAIEINAGKAITIANEAHTTVAKVQSTVDNVQLTLQTVKSGVNTAQSNIDKISKDVDDTKQVAQQSLKPAMLSFTASQILAQSFEDADAITVKDIYPIYADCIGKLVKQGFKMNHEGTLYKVIQPELTIQAQYVPGSVGTESLYAVIDETHTGTSEDPIPYFGNMELEQDKYYIQNSVLYHCTRGTGQPVYHALSDLVGLYVEVVEKA